MFQIKVCGVTNAADAIAATRLGADAIGLNFYSKSLRSVTIDDATQIATQIKRQSDAIVVGVFVNESSEHILNVAENVSLDMIQLHGDQSPTVVDQFCQQTTKPVIAVVRANAYDNPTTIRQINDFAQAGVAAVLLDAAVSGSYGGTGEKINWDTVRSLGATVNVPFILAGGLNPINVETAIKTAQPNAIDVASGLESIAGKKDYALLGPFVTRAKNAFSRLRLGQAAQNNLIENSGIDIERLLANYELVISRFEKQSCFHSEDFRSCCGSIESYLNDINCRDQLDNWMARLSSAGAVQLQSRIQPLDERLKQLQMGKRILIRPDLSPVYPYDEYFWYYGPLKGMENVGN